MCTFIYIYKYELIKCIWTTDQNLFWGCPQCSEPYLALAKRYEDVIVFEPERQHMLQQQAINAQFISLAQTGVEQSPRSGKKNTRKSRHSNSQRNPAEK